MSAPASWVHVAADLSRIDPLALGALRERLGDRVRVTGPDDVDAPGPAATAGGSPPAVGGTGGAAGRITVAAGWDVLVGWTPGADLLDASERLHTVVVPSAGVPWETQLLLDARPALAVRTLHHNAAATSEMALALLLGVARSVPLADLMLRAGDWSPRWAPGLTTLLEDRTALVVGYGQIGRRIARGCAGLGMDVLATRASARRPAFDGPAQVHPASALPDLLPRADVLILAAALSPRSRGLIGREELALLPPHALLVNVARADLVDQDALYDALAGGTLRGAGLDVWWHEADDPHDVVAPADRPFHELPNVVLSPHRGGAFTVPTIRQARLDALAQTLAEVVAARP